MKINYLVITLVLVSISAAWAQGDSDSDEIDFLYGFLAGSYHLIGKLPDSKETYTGQVVFKRTGDQLEVIRLIEGKEIKGVGKIEAATADKIKVLRVRFTEGDKVYEVTYLINSDLDNYGRLSGHLYLKEGGTKVPGLEALFINHQAPEQDSMPDKAD